MKNELDTGRAIEKYADTVRRICFMHLSNYSDVEDVFQDVFLKYLLYDKPFENAEHEKAWLIRVSINACKDVLKSFFRRNVDSLDALGENIGGIYIEENKKEILKAVLELPEKYRDVIYLFYYEGYSAVEISKILRKNENTIYTWLSRAKSQLKRSLGGEFFE